MSDKERTVQRAERVVPLDPFVFVCATRYAILRTLTGASEMVAAQVRAHADTIKREPGAAGAILKEIEEALPQILTPAGMGQTPYECRSIAAAWRAAGEALRDDA